MNSDNTNLIALLSGLGVPQTEAMTYAALLKTEVHSIRKIAAYTGINRGTTYEALKRLTVLGLASVRRQGNREHYTAESPEKILDIIRDKRRDLIDLAATAKTVIPELLARNTATAGGPLVRYYQDDEGIVAILRDVLQTCRDLPQREYVAYSSAPIRQYLYRKFPQFTKRRIEESIRVKVIALGEGGEIAEYSERRWLTTPENMSASSYTIIYGNKIATISTTKDTPYGVIIEDNGAASMQRFLFMQLWQYLDSSYPATTV